MWLTEPPACQLALWILGTNIPLTVEGDSPIGLSLIWGQQR